MNQRDMRPPFAALGGTIPPELEKLPTPCYLLDEDARSEEHTSELQSR